MSLSRKHLCFITAFLIGAGFLASPAVGQSQELDIAPFARRCCVTDHNLIPQIAFDYTSPNQLNGNATRTADGRYIYGLQWSEARDIKEVVVRFRPGSAPAKASVESGLLTGLTLRPRCRRSKTRNQIPGKGSG